MSLRRKRILPSSDPYYILGLMDGNSSDEPDSDLYSYSDDEQPSSPKSPLYQPTSSFQSHPNLSSTSSFQSYPNLSSTSSFQSFPTISATSSFQRYQTFATTSTFHSSEAALVSSPTLGNSSTSFNSSLQSHQLPVTTCSLPSSYPSPPPLPPPLVVPPSSFTGTRSCMEPSSCSSSTASAPNSATELGTSSIPSRQSETTLPFTSHPGVSKEAQNFTTPVDYISLFFRTDVKAMVYQESIRYEQLKMPTTDYLERHPKARANEWLKKPMQEEERLLEYYMALPQ
uniref:Uncharacterized protein n=1 Tax=Amphimedon queenslandica TaxID=400682 RepID=A0A1X7VBJ4_AMPQE